MNVCSISKIEQISSLTLDSNGYNSTNPNFYPSKSSLSNSTSQKNKKGFVKISGHETITKKESAGMFRINHIVKDKINLRDIPMKSGYKS